MRLFRWFRKKALAAAEVSGEARLVLSDMGLDEAIAAVATQRSEPALRDMARQFSQRFGPEVIPELRHRFDVMAEPPPDFSAREPSVSAWASRWWVALFEILYQYREYALPVLREMAFTDRHGTAVVLLCRLAAVEVGRERTVAEVRAQVPDLDFAVRCDVAGQLLWLARADAGLAAVLEELRQAPAFEEALVEVQQCGDGYGDPLRVAPVTAPRGAAGRRALLGLIAITLGGWAAVAVAGSTGVWGAIWVGGLVAAFSAAVLFLGEMAVLNRM